MDSIISPHVYSTVTLFGMEIPFITDAVITTWIVMAVIMVGVLLLTRKLETVPKGPQKVVEVLVETVNNLCRSQIGEKHWRTFAPYLGTMLIFLAVANTVALFNIIPTGEFFSLFSDSAFWEEFSYSLHAPTKNFNVTLCMALMTVGISLWAEIRFKGARAFGRGFYSPTPISGFVKVLDVVVRPLSLCLRLFGNMMGAAIVMTLMYNMLPIIVPAVVGIYFEIFDGLLQAYVFVFLSTIYIAEAVEEEH